MHRYITSRFWRTVTLLVADVLFFGITNPVQVSSFGLIVALVLMIVTLYWAIGSCIRLIQRYGGFALDNHRRQAVALTGLIAGLVALQSISELGSWDVLVLAPLVVLGYVYASYGRGRVKNESG